MISKELKEIIENNPIALSTIKENKPYNIAAAYAKVEEDKILITNNYMNQTIKNLQKNPQVSLVVWNKEWEGYQINGTVNYYTSGELYEKVKKMPENKDEPCKGAILITVKEVKRLA